MKKSSRKKIAIIGSVGLPANYGGFETLVNFLTLIKSSEFDITVFCQNTAKINKINKFNGSSLHYLPFKANGVQSVIYDITSIVLSWFKYDSILILGTGGCIVLPFLKIFRKTKTIVNFGGLEWKRNKWGNIGSWYLKLSEKVAIRNAVLVVADNQHFCNYIKEVYKKTSFLIEYGGDHTNRTTINQSLIEKYLFLKKDYDVSVSRAQEDNNLHLLLEAYSKFPERNLVLVSNYNKFKYGQDLKRKYSNFPNLFLQDAIYNQTELDAIRSNAKIYIHSHSYCGTAPSLVEAMNLGLPIIAFNVPTNHFTTEGKALYFTNTDDLLTIISSLTKEKIQIISESMISIAKKRYKWELITNKYAELF